MLGYLVFIYSLFCLHIHIYALYAAKIVKKYKPPSKMIHIFIYILDNFLLHVLSCLIL